MTVCACVNDASLYIKNPVNKVSGFGVHTHTHIYILSIYCLSSLFIWSCALRWTLYVSNKRISNNNVFSFCFVSLFKGHNAIAFQNWAYIIFSEKKKVHRKEKQAHGEKEWHQAAEKERTIWIFNRLNIWACRQSLWKTVSTLEPLKQPSFCSTYSREHV